MVTTLKSTAAKYHQWGANVVAMNTSDGDKRPLHQFKQWFYKRQTSLEVESLRTSQKDVPAWDHATAIALVCGINNFRMIDIDKCDDQQMVEDIIATLELPSGYPWCQRSGSGFGIWIRCDYTELPTNFAKVNTPWFIPVNDDAPFDHIELRLSHALGVVPPSLHPNGRYYQWLFTSPSALPLKVDFGTVLDVLFRYGQVQKISSRKSAPEINHYAIYRDSVFGRIARQYTLMEVALRLFPGDNRPAGRNNMRILGHGGLIVDDGRGWYCFADEIGGGLIDLFGYSLFGASWDRGRDQLFQVRSYAAELFRELP